MPRPAVDEALAVLAERCPDAPAIDADLRGAWAGALRGVADAHVLAAASSWPVEVFPRLTEFLEHLSDSQTSSSARAAAAPAPVEQLGSTAPEVGPTQAELAGMSRKDRSRAKLRAIREQFEAERAARAAQREAC